MNTALTAGGIGVLALTLALLVAPISCSPPRLGNIPATAAGPVPAGLEPLSRAATAATEAIDAILSKRGAPGAGALEQAGVRMRLQDFVFLVVVAALVAFAVRLVASGPLFGLLPRDPHADRRTTAQDFRRAAAPPSQTSSTTRCSSWPPACAPGTASSRRSPPSPARPRSPPPRSSRASSTRPASAATSRPRWRRPQTDGQPGLRVGHPGHRHQPRGRR